MQEYMSEIVEKRFLSLHAECLLNSLVRVGPDSRRWIIKDFSTPLFLSEKEIKTILDGYKNDPKYQSALANYPMKSR